MSFDGFPIRANIPELYFYVTRLLGANGAALTPEEPDLAGGVTHARTGEGVYTMAWASSPGTFVGAWPSFGAATMADVDDYQWVRDTWDSSLFTLTFTVYAVTTAADLIANQYLDLIVAFRRSGAGT